MRIAPEACRLRTAVRGGSKKGKKKLEENFYKFYHLPPLEAATFTGQTNL